MAIPTLARDGTFLECLSSLRQQTHGDFDVVIVDNSGKGLVHRLLHQSEAARLGAMVIEMDHNVGFGAAVNAAFRRSRAPFLATLNDDAVACPGWLEALVTAMETQSDAGMCASQVRLSGERRLDSAGMLICRDGSSKQRGHLRAPDAFRVREEVLFPSASAALYRRAMLDQTGFFDEEFFLYCEDTDLGLRARWAGWKCVYVPEAAVEHRYSHSAGRASPLKAYYVERNRLFVAIKNFPPGMLARVPFFSVARYFWHIVAMLQGRGQAAEFRREQSGIQLVWLVMRAHLAAAFHCRGLWRKRKEIRGTARLTPPEFMGLVRAHGIGVREMAEF